MAVQSVAAQADPARGVMCVPKLANRIVGVVDRLPSLLTHYTDADVCRLDHGHVIGPCT